MAYTSVCPNGHALEPGWAVCPYCPAPAARAAPLPPTEPIAGLAPAPTVPLAAGPTQRETVLMRAPMAQQAVAWLVAADPDRRGQILRIDRPRMAIGASAPCELRIDDPRVSGRHASVSFADGQFRLADEGSSNGTWVNGVEIREHQLADGDRVRFGALEWVFKCVVFDYGSGPTTVKHPFPFT